MMKLTTMWNVVDTVDEQWGCPPAEEILQRWGFDSGTVRFFRASANFVCVFRREGMRHFLRFNAASERSLEAMEAEVRLVDWLDRQGVAVARPVPSARGHLVETAELPDLGVFHAVVFEGLQGPHREMEALGPAGFRAWGAALGKLHAAMGRYSDPSLACRPTWRDHMDLARRYIPDSEPAMLAEWEYVTAWAAGLPAGPDQFGLIHYDFETDNLCWYNDTIAALDFDDCAAYWYVADIAYALRDLFADGANLDHPLFREFVAGYAEHHPADDGLLAQLPMFQRLHDLYVYGRLSRSLDLPADCELPPWLERLNAKLQGKVEQYRSVIAARGR